MMPVHPGTWLAYAFAVLSGFAFGFVLENAGFGSSRKLAAQFYLKDMTVLKVMFSAIVTAMLGLTLLRAVGVLDFDRLFVNPTFLGPQVVGGVIFGVGFAVGGYCP
ncbi:MAG: YeeE/YedE family protein, partial [Candidatus Eisenbacteria bacterium]|nr:YeeE/YedE family protein [Candidatus Eisenbacteria bacterium]